MGLIKAGIGALGGTLAEQLKEFFYCEAMPKEVLVTKGQKRFSGRYDRLYGYGNLFAMGQQQQQAQPSALAAAPATDIRKCACGATATGIFCPECGNPFDDGDIIG